MPVEEVAAHVDLAIAALTEEQEQAEIEIRRLQQLQHSRQKSVVQLQAFKQRFL